MLTIFSCPKPFTNPHINIIQRNAIKSWTLLQPRPEIILIGDEIGTAEVAKQLNISHMPWVARNEYGTPLVNSVFAEAEKVANNQVLCYVNADIILMSDFIHAIQEVLKNMSSFLIVGQRWDVDINEELDFSANWEQKLKSYVFKNGKLHPPTGLDYFVYTKGIYSDIPPFAIGRGAWDNWLIYYPYSQKVPVIDITPVTTVVHQNHDYSHIPNTLGPIWKNPEAKVNLRLAGGWRHQYTINDARYILLPTGLKLQPIGKHIRERLKYFFVVPIRKTAKRILKRG
jgi:hypothetical protein